MALDYSDLDQYQQQVVDHSNGDMLVTAPPGGGKTETMIHRYRRLIEDEGNSPGQIALLSYNRKAADELKERSAELLENYEQKDLSYVRTIHSLFSEILRSYKDELGWDRVDHFEDNIDRREFWTDICMDFVENLDFSRQKYTRNEMTEFVSNHKKELYNIHGDVSVSIKTLSSSVNTGSTPRFKAEDTNLREENLQEMYRILSNNAEKLKSMYLNRMEEKEKVTFTGAAYFAWKILRDSSDARDELGHRFNEVIVDEAQDLNPLRYEFVSRMAKNSPCDLVLIGDTAQTLYEYDGADPSIITERFQREHDVSERVLAVNYRSSETIVALNNEIRSYLSVSSFESESHKGKLPESYGYPRLIQIPYAIQKENYSEKKMATQVLADAVAEEVSKMIDIHNYDPDEIALISRTGLYSMHYANSFAETGVTHTNLNSSTDFEDRREVQMITRWLEAVEDPRSLKMRELVQEEADGIGENMCNRLVIETEGEYLIDAMRKADDSVAGLGEAKLESIDQFLDDYETVKEADHKVEAVMDVIDVESRLIDFCDGNKDKIEQRRKNVEGLVDRWEKFSGLKEFLDTLSSDEDGVVISTVHKAKGREWPVVFFVDFGKMDVKNRENDGKRFDLSELRIVYTGISRAKEKLIFCSINNPNSTYGLISDIVKRGENQHERGVGV